MNKVVIVNLAGRPWHLEEGAYDALRAYLDDAGRRLADTPDADDVLADFEAAIAEHCSEALDEHRTVVEAGAMQEIIARMGPVVVDADQASIADAPPPAPPDPPRRLFRIREGRLLGGVCTGLAAYFNVDVTVVRALVVIATFATSGAGLLVYVAMLFFVPEATTADERATARGRRIDAQAVLRRARAGAPALAGVGAFLLTVLRVAALAIAVVATVASIVVLAAWVAALWSTLADGHVFGFSFDPGTDPWLLRVWVTCVAWVVLAPVVAVALACWWLGRGRPRRQASPMWPIAGVALWVAAIVSAVMIAWTSTPDVRQAFEDDAGTAQFGRYEVCVEDGSWHDAEDEVACPDGTTFHPG